MGRTSGVGNERTTYLAPAEAWAIDDMVRHTWADEGRPIGRALLMKVFAVIKEFEARRNDSHPPDVLPIALSDDECWTIDFHIRRNFVDPEGFRVGRPLLLKIFGLILEMRNQEDVRTFPGAPEAPHSTEMTRRFEEWRDLLRDEPGEGDAEDPPLTHP